MKPGEISEHDDPDVWADGGDVVGSIVFDSPQEKTKSPARFTFKVGDKHAMTISSSGIVDVMGKQVIFDPTIYFAFAGWCQLSKDLPSGSIVFETGKADFPSNGYGSLRFRLGDVDRLVFRDGDKDLKVVIDGKEVTDKVRVYEAFRQWLSDVCARVVFSEHDEAHTLGSEAKIKASE